MSPARADLAQLVAQRHRLLHVGLGVQGEVRDRRLGLRHPLGDLDLGAAELLDRDRALVAAGGLSRGLMVPGLRVPGLRVPGLRVRG